MNSCELLTNFIEIPNWYFRYVENVPIFNLFGLKICFNQKIKTGESPMDFRGWFEPPQVQ